MTKKTIFQYLKDKIKEKPATREEIEQLKLDWERARLKAGIAEQKGKAKRTKPGLASLLESPKKQSQPRQAKTKFIYIDRQKRQEVKRPKINQDNRVDEVFGSSKVRDFRSITG